MSPVWAKKEIPSRRASSTTVSEKLPLGAISPHARRSHA